MERLKFSKNPLTLEQWARKYGLIKVSTAFSSSHNIMSSVHDYHIYYGLYTFFHKKMVYTLFYKNIVYKNIKAQIFRNLRIIQE